MINPISSAHAGQVYQSSQQSVQQPKPQTQPEPQDTVSLKSVGDADHDGDNK